MTKRTNLYILKIHAAMAELADAIGSGPIERNLMEVQILLAAPEKKLHFCSFSKQEIRPPKNDYHFLE